MARNEENYWEAVGPSSGRFDPFTAEMTVNERIGWPRRAPLPPYGTEEVDAELRAPPPHLELDLFLHGAIELCLAEHRPQLREKLQRCAHGRLLARFRSDGVVQQALHDAGHARPLFALDFHAEGLSFARERVRCGLVQGELQRAPFRTKFDVVGIFDVLEHLPDGVAALAISSRAVSM